MCEDAKGCAKQAEGESLLSRIERLERDLIERKYPKPKFFPGDEVIYLPYGKDSKTRIESKVLSVTPMFYSDLFVWMYNIYLFEETIDVRESFLVAND